MATAAVHDDAGAFPGFDEAPAGLGAVELYDEVVQVVHLLHQVGGVGLHFVQEGTAIDDLAARQIHRGGEIRDGRGDGVNAVARHAAAGRAGFTNGGVGEVADAGGFIHEVLLAQLHDRAFLHVHFAEAIQVARLFEVAGQGACEDKRGVFEGAFGGDLGVGAAAGGGIRQRSFGGGVGVAGLEPSHVRGEVGGRLAGPDGYVVGTVGDREAGAHHV